jgi:hypothetical protein
MNGTADSRPPSSLGTPDVRKRYTGGMERMGDPKVAPAGHYTYGRIA